MTYARARSVRPEEEAIYHVPILVHDTRSVRTACLRSAYSTLSTCSLRMGNGSAVWSVVKNMWLVW